MIAVQLIDESGAIIGGAIVDPETVEVAPYRFDTFSDANGVLWMLKDCAIEAADVHRCDWAKFLKLYKTRARKPAAAQPGERVG